MATTALFRATVRAIRAATPDGAALRIRQPVLESPVQWMAHEPLPQHLMIEETPATMIGGVFPSLLDEAGALRGGHDLWGDGLPLELSRERCTRIARSRFADAESASLDEGFAALRALGDQIALAQRTSVARTSGLCVEASSAYRGRAQAGLWVFSYRLRVRNESDEPVRLLGRHWMIRNADGSVHAEVPKWGAGIVGQTPLLSPGAAFEYASGTSLSSPNGSIEGAIRAERGDGHNFEAAVGCFPLLSSPSYD
mmetsp:Transcript_30931/g.97561  ORF Transcript_30931/g.97561 Transcript_30931/m.97561 type:complete len:254 (+) Transcript_30931:332-1093(+)